MKISKFYLYNAALIFLVVLLTFPDADAQAQIMNVTGTVRSADDNNPLVGVTIQVQNTNRGTASEKDGSFSVSASRGDTLIFSFIGFDSKSVAVAGSTLNVELSPSTSRLNDLVVVGYGTQKRENLTSAISTTTGKELKSVPVPSISNSFAGRLTGVTGVNVSGEPGYDDATLLIRGMSTLGDNSPLIVIDGVADRAGGFSRLDPNDIENVSILKDASASIYGSRAANGVILITTKRGVIGAPTVDYTFNYGLRQPTRLPKMLDAATYAMAFNEIEEDVYGRAPRYSDEDIKLFRDGTDPLSHPNTDWLKETLRKTSPQIQQNLSLNGGTERVKYYLSLGHQYQDGYYRKGATNYKQYNIRGNIDVKVSEKLSVFMNLSGRQEERNYPHHGSEVIFRYAQRGVPTANAYLPGTNLPTTPLGDDVNPVAAVTDIAGYQKDDRAYYNADIGFNLTLPFGNDDFSLTGRMSIDKSDLFYKSFFKDFSLYKMENDMPVAQTFGPGHASLNENMSQDQGLTEHLRINYKHDWNNVHKVDAFIGYEQYNYHNDFLSGARANYTTTQVDELFAGPVDDQTTNNGSANELSRRNYFGRVNYDFSNKYLFQFNWRYDGSQNFPKGKRYGFFPGVSLGWNISNEDFFSRIKESINLLKIRGSWGQMGNDKIAQFQFLSTYSFGTGGVFGGVNPRLAPSTFANVLANPNVTWEVANEVDLGFDMILAENSLSITFDYFHTKRRNILASRAAAVPDFMGISLPDENLGRTKNQGIELSSTYSKTLGEWRFSAGANFTYNKSEVLFAAEAKSVLPWQQFTGKPIGSNFVLLKAVGIFQSEDEINKTPHLEGTKPGDLIFEDVNLDGTIDGNDAIRYNRSPIPRIVYGIPLKVSYKNWNVDILFQGQTISAQYIFYESGEIGNFTQTYWDQHWTPEKPEAKGPRLYDRNVIPSTEFANSFFLENSGFLRLKSAQISYDLPSKIFGSGPVDKINVFASGFNLLTFSKIKDIDPEGQANSQDFAGWYTPQTRVFNFGFNINFK